MTRIIGGIGTSHVATIGLEDFLKTRNVPGAR
jgi:galactitol-specific phosphotransferase system IIB component